MSRPTVMLQGLLRLFIACCLPLLLMAGTAHAASEIVDTGLDPQWRLVSDRNGIKVYIRHNDASRLKTFRGVMVMHMPDEYALAAVINDYPNVPNWLYFVDGVTEIKRDSPLVRYVRFTTTPPWPISNRDAVARAVVKQRLTPQEESVTIEFTNMPTLIAKDPDYVRFPELQAKLKMRRLPADKMEVTYEVVMDPGGYIPGWIVNIIAKDTPYFTLKKLSAWIQRAEYQNKFYDYVEVRGPGRPNSYAPPRSYLYGFPPDKPYPEVPTAKINELKR